VGIINSSVDEKEIENAYQELQQIISDNVPVSALFAEQSLAAVNDNRIAYGILKSRGPLLDIEKWDLK
jgi:ABC-type transport system substrate-binding protein